MNEEYMKVAIKEAMIAYKKDEIPVGAVIVKNNKIISKSRNNRQKKCNVLGHAEINAILKAEKKLKDWRLNGCILYVTLEPCEMCKKIIQESRINETYYLISSKFNVNNSKCNYKQMFCPGSYFSNYIDLFKKYFKKMR